VFAFPWEGVTIVGTTDVDHLSPLCIDPSISAEETDYLLSAVCNIFPKQEIGVEDVQATFSGIRPVVNTGNSDPSKESREHILWNERGLLTVTGGKLTTFRLMAHDALHKIQKRLPNLRIRPGNQRVLNQTATSELAIHKNLSPAMQLRLVGRHGNYARDLLAISNNDDDLNTIESSPTLWAEIRWAARSEAVLHLDDLMLRRVRLGLILPQGGLMHMNRIRSIVQTELGWDDDRWVLEINNYTQLWKRCYHLNEATNSSLDTLKGTENNHGHPSQQTRFNSGNRQRHPKRTSTLVQRER
jgi:glycerol-3-phosphate dehydrogenase